MVDKKISEVLSDFYKDQIQMEDLKKQLGEAVLENYKDSKENEMKK